MERVSIWKDSNTGPFDTAGKGKSALLAAACRNIKAEVYGQTEDQVIAVFHDFENFFRHYRHPYPHRKSNRSRLPHT